MYYNIGQWQCLVERVALCAGEMHCPYCGGHGYLPVSQREYGITRFAPPRCDWCNGAGKSHDH